MLLVSERVNERERRVSVLNNMMYWDFIIHGIYTFFYYSSPQLHYFQLCAIDSYFVVYQILSYCYHTISHHTILYYILPYYTIPYHTIFYNFIEYYTIPYHTIPYHTIPYYNTLHWIGSYRTLLHFVTFLYLIWYYIISCFLPLFFLP